MPDFAGMARQFPITSGLIIINLVLFAGQYASRDNLTALGLLYGPAVQQGNYWRIVSSGFLHGGLLHVAFNMYLLYMLGPTLERAFGRLTFISIYFTALLGGSLTVLLLNFAQPTLGASGAVLGLAGTMGMVMWRRGQSLRQSPVLGLVLLNLALPLLLPGISFWGHLGGIVAGAGIGYLLTSKSLIANSGDASRNPALYGLTLVTILAVCSIVAARLGGL